MWSADTKKDDSGSDEDDSEEESEEESDSDDAKPQAEQSRADRKAAAKARKEAAIAKKKGQAVEVGDLPPSDSEEESDDDMPANPNHSKAARNQTKAPPKEVEEATEGVKKLAVANNRKERESMEAALAKERYRKLHEAGKTDEAKADMARLRLIREQRAADAARREVCLALEPAISYCSCLTTGCYRPRRRSARLRRLLRGPRLRRRRPRRERLLWARPLRRARSPANEFCQKFRALSFVYHRPSRSQHTMRRMFVFEPQFNKIQAPRMLLELSVPAEYHMCSHYRFMICRHAPNVGTNTRLAMFSNASQSFGSNAFVPQLVEINALLLEQVSNLFSHLGLLLRPEPTRLR